MNHLEDQLVQLETCFERIWKTENPAGQVFVSTVAYGLYNEQAKRLYRQPGFKHIIDRIQYPVFTPRLTAFLKRQTSVIENFDQAWSRHVFIYKFIVGDETYIGQTVNPMKRWMEHVTGIGSKHTSEMMWKAVKNFTLPTMEFFDLTTKKYASKVERYYIESLEAVNRTNMSESYKKQLRLLGRVSLLTEQGLNI